LVLTTTIFVTLPEIAGPDFVTEGVTRTAIKLGIVVGGLELPPGDVFQVIPHFGDERVSAKPLKLAGASPPLKPFNFAHCAPQNSPLVPTAAFWSPRMKAPLVRNANEIVLALAEEGRKEASPAKLALTVPGPNG
jgi:hypothetical protein